MDNLTYNLGYCSIPTVIEDMDDTSETSTQTTGQARLGHHSVERLPAASSTPTQIDTAPAKPTSKAGRRRRATTPGRDVFPKIRKYTSSTSEASQQQPQQTGDQPSMPILTFKVMSEGVQHRESRLNQRQNACSHQASTSVATGSNRAQNSDNVLDSEFVNTFNAKLKFSESESLNPAVNSLLIVFKEKKLDIKDSLYKFINSCPEENSVNLINKITVYFKSRNPKVIKNTTTLTSMLYLGEGNSTTVKKIKSLLETSDENIQQVAQSEYLKSISSMCNGKGLPEKAKVETFLKLACLKEGWLGDDDAVKDKPLDRALVTNISSMCSGKGLPEKAKVEAFLKLAGLKEGWQGNNDAVKDKPLNRAWPDISSMRHGKGLPEKAKVDDCLKKIKSRNIPEKSPSLLHLTK